MVLSTQLSADLPSRELGSLTAADRPRGPLVTCRGRKQDFCRNLITLGRIKITARVSALV